MTISADCFPIAMLSTVRANQDWFSSFHHLFNSATFHMTRVRQRRRFITILSSMRNAASDCIFRIFN